jgi:uncharacterized membrane protein
MIESIAIIFLAFGGFSLSAYLFHKKREKKETFICPFRGKCSEVIQSKFSKFLGINVEVVGMFYYGSLALGYGLLSIFPTQLSGLSVYLMLASLGAFFFSLYLTFVQIVVLRKLCTWCLLSATLSTSIALFSVFGALEVLIPFLMDYQSLSLTIYALFMGIGLGATTLSDVFFFKFLRDFRISEKEMNVLSTISEFIWLSMGMILVSGIASFIPSSAFYGDSTVFLAQSIVFVVIIINGAFLNLVVAPKLMMISFRKKHKHEEGELHHIRRIAFSLGPISITSWYFLFIIGITPISSDFSLLHLLLIYLLLLGVSVAIGLISDKTLYYRARKTIAE